MAYKAKVLKKFIENNQIRLVVEFKKGSTVVEQEFTISSPTQFKSELNRRIMLLEELDAFAAEPLGDVNLTPEPVVVSNPTPAELKRQEFRDKLDELTKKKRYLDLGLLQESDVSALKADLKNLGKQIGEF